MIDRSQPDMGYARRAGRTATIRPRRARRVDTGKRLSKPRGEGGDPHRVLVVDDEASVRLLLRRVLDQWGFAVSTASDGLSGLREFHANDPDLVITDLNMPGVDGLRLIEAIRQAGWTGLILAMSGSSKTSTWHERALALGANAILDKPFTPDQLRQTISQIEGPNATPNRTLTIQV